MLSRMSVTAAKQAGRTFSTTSQVRAVYLFRTQEIYLYIANFPYIYVTRVSFDTRVYVIITA